MDRSPSHNAERRARRRARLRRQRLGALVGALGLVALVGALVAVLGGGNGGGAVANQPAPSPASATHHPRDRQAPPTRVAATVKAAGNSAILRLAQLGLPIYCAGPRGNAVALTFDDGPGPYTNLALKKLTQAHERATFFVVGKSMDIFPGYLPRELKLAAIADHTYTHPFLPALAPSLITSQLERTRQKIERDSGQHVDLFRPPYGSRNAVVDRTAKRLGLLEILWSVDSADSLGASYAGIVKNVEAGLRPGAIILMHENRGQTIRALTTLLHELRRRHLRSVSLPELFAADLPSPRRVRQGSAGCGAVRVARPGAGG